MTTCIYIRELDKWCATWMTASGRGVPDVQTSCNMRTNCMISPTILPPYV